MQWLVSQMWIALAVAGVLGILFGMAIRGLFGAGKVRRAQVERDVAKTELEQTRGEVDALYAAQRKQKIENGQAVSGDDNSAGELAAARLELDGLKAELEKAKEGGDDLVGKAGAALAGAAAGTMLGGDDAAGKELTERNTWLEERVSTLEADLTAAQSANAGESVGMADGEGEGEGGATSEEDIARLRWRNRYLEGRLAYFEEGSEEASEDDDGGMIAEGLAIVGAVAAGGAALVSDGEDTIEEAVEEVSETVEEVAEEVSEAVDDVAEEVVETVEETVEDAADEVAETVENAAEDVTEVTEEVSQAVEETVDQVEETVDQVEETVEEAAEAATVEEHPSDAVLKELDTDEGEAVGEVEQVQPMQMDAPADGGGDDLSAIAGIGPRIGEVLNELGIWSYAQIAEWTPENEAWVEQHLSFKGRVSREGWVEQAKALIATDT